MATKSASPRRKRAARRNKPPPENWMASNPFVGDEAVPIAGVCAVCGCTDENACAEGCSWINKEHTLCSLCGENLGVIETDWWRRG